ncbi:MAG: CheR family methyltransferase [Planctomycetota bacterium]|jgi:chemotaxis protein methyltransferase CheR
MKATREEVAIVRRILHRATGIVLAADKAYLVRSVLTPIAYEEGEGSLATVIERLQAEPGGALERKVVEALLNNETWFFRDPHFFHALRHDVLPALQASGRRPVRIWSAACSSGQEPYSIAMTVHHHFPGLWEQTEILATDLSDRMLARAQHGAYSQLEVNRGLPAPLLVRYFAEEGADWRIDPVLGKRITFRSLNLTQEWPDLPSMDVVFVRNVLLYFDNETRREVLGRVRRQLRSDGTLILGAAEATFPTQENYAVRTCGKAAYYRVQALEVRA